MTPRTSTRRVDFWYKRRTHTTRSSHSLLSLPLSLLRAETLKAQHRAFPRGPPPQYATLTEYYRGSSEPAVRVAKPPSRNRYDHKGEEGPEGDEQGKQDEYDEQCGLQRLRRRRPQCTRVAGIGLGIGGRALSGVTQVRYGRHPHYWRLRTLTWPPSSTSPATRRRACRALPTGWV